MTSFRRGICVAQILFIATCLTGKLTLSYIQRLSLWPDPHSVAFTGTRIGVPITAMQPVSFCLGAKSAGL